MMSLNLFQIAMIYAACSLIGMLPPLVMYKQRLNLARFFINILVISPVALIAMAYWIEGVSDPVFVGWVSLVALVSPTAIYSALVNDRLDTYLWVQVVTTVTLALAVVYLYAIGFEPYLLSAIVVATVATTYVQYKYLTLDVIKYKYING